jgi:hypothetical protein
MWNMDETVTEYRMRLERELQRWKRFQDFLRIDERAVFEDMLNEYRRHSSAERAACFPNIAGAMFLTILFKHHQTLKKLREQIDKINQSIEKKTPRPGSEPSNK